MNKQRGQQLQPEKVCNDRSIDLKLSSACTGDPIDPSVPHTNGTVESTPSPSPRSNREIAEVLREFIGHRTYREVGRDTGFHAESVRRYLQGKTKIPADFVSTACHVYNIDAMAVLVKDACGPYRTNPRPKPEDRLAESLVEWLRPRMERWMQTNVVPNGVFLRPMKSNPECPEREEELSRDQP